MLYSSYMYAGPAQRADVFCAAPRASGHAMSQHTRSKAEDKDYGELKRLINALSAKVDSKFDKLSKQITQVKTDVLNEVETRIKTARDELLVDIAGLTARIEALEGERDTAVADQSDIRAVAEFDPEYTVVAVNLPSPDDEDLTDTVSRMLQTLDVDDDIVSRTHRLRGRDGKLGLVKVQVKSKNAKIEVLRAKRRLKDSGEFRRTYLRSSKSHVERLVDLNFRTILQEMPGGNQYRITGNGRLVKKTEGATGYGEQSPRQNRQINPLGGRTPTPPARPRRDQRREQMSPANHD